MQGNIAVHVQKKKKKEKKKNTRKKPKSIVYTIY